MKLVMPPEMKHRLTRCGYLAFALTMLHLVRRGRDKNIANENFLSLFTAVIPTELAHSLLALNAFVVYYLYKSKTPVLSRWIGGVAGVIQCVALVKLAELQKSNVEAKHYIREAMEESDIPPEQLQAIGDMNWRRWLTVLLPVPKTTALSVSFPGVSKTDTVIYAHVGKAMTTRLKMDVYKHKSTPADAPILLYIHGGGWIVGNRKNPTITLVYQAAAMGWVVCVIDYRKSPKVAFPTHLIDIKRAIAYLRKNARAKFAADPEFIVVAGESAGGHLASLVALTANEPFLQPGFESVDTTVRGCVDTYGVHDFKDRHGFYFYKNKDYSFKRFIELLVMQKNPDDFADEFEQASPIYWLSPAKAAERKQPVPPFLVSHGTLDTLVPFDDSTLFFEKLQKHRQREATSNSASSSSVEDVFLEIPDAHHAFNYLISPRTLAHGDAVCVFLQNLHARSKPLRQLREDALIPTAAISRL